jgi:hypothetical protein
MRFIGFLLSLLLFVGVAHADVSPELGVGADRYNVVSNGTWYQLGIPGDYLKRNSFAYEVGAVDNFALSDSYGLGVHADYVNLGHTQASCDCTTIDADYSHLMHAFIGANVPKAYYSGSGLFQGIKLSASSYYVVNGFKVGIDAGVLYYRPTWIENVQHWSLDNEPPYASGHLSTPVSPHFAPVAGLFVTRGKFTVSYEFYWVPVQPNEYNVPPIYTGAQVLMLSYAL